MTRKRWSTVPATRFDIMSWSHGEVRTLEELYDPAIFGSPAEPRQSWSSSDIWELSDDTRLCVVGATPSPDLLRIGHIELALQIDNPFVKDPRLPDASMAFWSVIPIAPIAYRRSHQGAVSVLGQKYETLFREHQQLKQDLPPFETPEFHDASSRADTKNIERCILDIIGWNPNCKATEVQINDQTLLGILIQSMFSFEPTSAAIFRACLLSLAVDVVV